MKKTLFIYWEQKFINAPNVVKKSLLSWKLKNPSWKIIQLDGDNLNQYINIEKEIPNIKNKTITKTSYSDIVRIFLLSKYGGCWCDATTFCNKPLDKWLHKHISTGFFAFNKPNKDRLLSSWFLYSEKNNYITQKWKEKTITYWKNHNYMHDYFWFHSLFCNLYNSDNTFKNIWHLTPTISAGGPHYLRKQLLKPITNETINHIDKVKVPIYKLTYKYNEQKFNKKCNLSYLLNTIKLKFIHIPKTGGTSIENAAKKNNLLWGKFDTSLKSSKNNKAWHCPQKIPHYCFCVIRNPFDRFISQFYHENEIKDYNKEKLNNFIEVKIPQIQNNMNIDGNHFLPQYKFYKKCDIMISFDNLQNNLNKLMKMFHLRPLILDKLPGGKRQQRKRNKIQINRLIHLDINEKNRSLIKEIYNLDFKLYNNIKKLGIFIKDNENCNLTYLLNRRNKYIQI